MTINQELMNIILFQVGGSNIKFNIQSHVVMGCKLFLFRYQVALMLRSVGYWKSLIGYPNDLGKNDSNLGASSIQTGETNVGEYRH